NADKLAFLINECREMGIKILPPDINSSGISFSVDKGCIRFGLGAIKGCGEAAAGKIIESRNTDGPFTSFLDFCERCGSDVNSRMLEFLTRSGAFDSLGLRRSQILAIAEPMIAFAAERARDKANGQGSLFDLLDSDGGGNDMCTVPIPDVPEFEWAEILKSEKELLGCYVSGHPLQPKSALLRSYATPIRELDNCADNSTVRLAGMVLNYTVKIGKTSQKPFGVLLLEDLDANCECLLYKSGLHAIENNNVPTYPGAEVILEATVRRSQEGEKPRLTVEKIHSLDAAPEEYAEELFLHIYQNELKQGVLKELAEIFRNADEGKTKLYLCIVTDTDDVVFVEPRTPSIKLTKAMLDRATALLGEDHYRIKPAACTPPPKRWSKPQETTITE
ncbi:MAG: hypothetical protein J6S90_08295, partial [Lentisphaeria bacterium]|nr:hypothetical protein [Lentisphaeria bacterium]